MARGDIVILDQNSTQGRGARLYNTAASTNAILAGEPVARALGAIVVYGATTNTPVVGTDYFVGVAATDATHTSTAAGTVNVYPLASGTTYLISPKDSTAWDTQAEYDALVGKRVLLDLTTGAYTILASDSSTSGCIIMPLDIKKYPGKVAFCFRQALSDVQ